MRVFIVLLLVLACAGCAPHLPTPDLSKAGAALPSVQLNLLSALPLFGFKWAYIVSAVCIVFGILSPVIGVWFPIPPKLTGALILCGVLGYIGTYVIAVSFIWIVWLAIISAILFALHIAFTIFNHRDGKSGFLVWLIEKWTKRDIDGDGQIGQPATLPTTPFAGGGAVTTTTQDGTTFTVTGGKVILSSAQGGAPSNTNTSTPG